MAGTKQQLVSRWENGDCWPSVENLILLSKATGKSIDWLLTGEGETPEPPPGLVMEEAVRLRVSWKGDSFSRERYVPVPVLKGSRAAQTPGRVGDDDVEGWALVFDDREWMPHDRDFYTCAGVRDDSMRPILAEGDIVAIDHADRDPALLRDRMTAFRADDGGVTVKWLRLASGHELVIGEPENRSMAHTAVYLKGREIESGIVGRVAWWWAKR